MAHQPDEVVATNKGGGFAPHPAGQFAAVCADVVNFGEKVEQYADKPQRLTPKVGLVFRTGEKDEKGEYVDITREFTVSMGEKSNLRQFLEMWRGRSYTPDEVEQGAPLHKLCGVACLLTIEHKPSGDKVYANIRAISPLPKLMQGHTPDVSGYKRPKYLEDRKAKYAEEAKRFRATINAPSSRNTGDDFHDFPPAQDGDDDLPF